MALVIPWLGRRRYRSLQQALRSGNPRARSRVYVRSLIAKWAPVLSLAILAAVGMVSWAGLGVRYSDREIPPRMWIFFLVLFALTTVYFRKRGEKQIARLMKMAGAIVPTSLREQWLFAALAISAGITEELLYRGFFVFYLGTYAPGLARWAVIAACALLFGIAHLYQGWTGVLFTGTLGAILTILYMETGSLLAPVVLHSLIDLRILFILPPQRLRALAAHNQ